MRGRGERHRHDFGLQQTPELGISDYYRTTLYSSSPSAYLRADRIPRRNFYRIELISGHHDRCACLFCGVGIYLRTSQMPTLPALDLAVMSVWFVPDEEDAKVQEVGLAGSFEEGKQQAERHNDGPLAWDDPDGIRTDGYQAMGARGVYSVIPNTIRGDEPMIVPKKRRDPRGAKSNPNRKHIKFTRRQLHDRFEMAWPVSVSV